MYYIGSILVCNYFFFLQCRKVVSVSRFILSTFHFTLSSQIEYFIFLKSLLRLELGRTDTWENRVSWSNLTMSKGLEFWHTVCWPSGLGSTFGGYNICISHVWGVLPPTRAVYA